MKLAVLVVEDEPDVADLVRHHLRRAGLDVSVAVDGLGGLREARDRRPDLIVLDMMLPEMDGRQVCKELKRDPDTAAIPVLMLTARAAQEDRIAGLEMGADDYVTKPFSPRELVLRVQALLRRTQRAEAGAGCIDVDEFHIDKSKFSATLAGTKLDLTSTEFKLLSILIERRGRTQSRDTLLTDVWGYNTAIDTRTVDVHMRRLREKLGAHAHRIETLRGDGYRFTTGGIS